MERISEHISYQEATMSDTAVRKNISNVPDENQLKRMKLVAENCFEPIRKEHGKPIRVTSFFRSKELNAAIGGSSSTSQHMQGEAIDFVCENMKELFEWIRRNVEFDQLIWEYGTDTSPDWIHISYTEQRPNRQEVLRVRRINGETTWRRI